MILVDSNGWIEYFRNGMLAERFEKYLSELDKVVIPVVLIYEVYKKVKKERGEEQALQIVGQMMKAKVVNLDAELMLSAGDISIKHSIPMVDAIIYATAIKEKCPVVTSDPHLEKLENVIYINPERYKHTPGVG
jgi:predicted nucleic acid-binding protein